jgi:hypothetical protein
MWRRSSRNAEKLPWYRSPKYKGGLKEAEKRQLDGFRMQERHPAATEDDLPEEVQAYISTLEREIYDAKQDKAIERTIVLTIVSGAILYLSYYGHPRTESIWPYAFGLALIVVAWFIYRIEWNKNAEEFLPSDPQAPTTTDERIKQEWESIYIVNRRRAERGQD